MIRKGPPSLAYDNRPIFNQYSPNNNSNNKPPSGVYLNPPLFTNGPESMPGQKFSRIESKVHGVLPSEGSIDGENVAHVYFSVNYLDWMNRYRKIENPSFSFFRFDGWNVLKFSLSVKNDDHISLDAKFKSHRLRNECKKAKFVVRVIVPPGRRSGLVDVTMYLNQGKFLGMTNGYKYLGVNKPQRSPQQQIRIHHQRSQRPQNNMNGGGGCQGCVGQQREKMDTSPEDGCDPDYENDYGFFQKLDPLFGSPYFFWPIAQGNFDLVDELCKRGIIDLDIVDLMGVSAMHVAKYFENIENNENYEKIVKLLNRYNTKEKTDPKKRKVEVDKKKKNVSAKKNISKKNENEKRKKTVEHHKKIRRISCSFCDKKVEIRGRRLYHKCKGKSRKANFNGTKLEDMRVYHMKKVKRGSKVKHKVLDVKKWMKTGKCSGCGVKFKGGELHKISRKSITITTN